MPPLLPSVVRVAACVLLLLVVFGFLVTARKHLQKHRHVEVDGVAYSPDGEASSPSSRMDAPYSVIPKQAWPWRTRPTLPKEEQIDYHEFQIPSTSHQVHLSFGEKPGEYVITWLTARELKQPYVELTPVHDSHTEPIIVLGMSEYFQDNGTMHNTQWVHRATTNALPRGAVYTYRVSQTDDDEDPDHLSSPLLRFEARPKGPNDSTRVAIYGDFGLDNPVSYPHLKQEVEGGSLDFIIHAGDFAYDMHNENGTVGDRWFKFVEPVYSAVPVMTCIGNHEGMYNYLHYRKRFSMPQHDVTSNLFYSFDYGPVHYIAFSTEVYFSYDKTKGLGRTFGPYPELQRSQRVFIENDLMGIDRLKTPWIVAFGHRPMYCSDNDALECVRDTAKMWRGELEDLFFTYKVDFVFSAHQHSYERLLPTYRGQVKNGTINAANPYEHPNAPIYIVSGSAGCVEKLDAVDHKPMGPWSARRVFSYGYGHLTVHNHTHAIWNQIDATDQSIVDQIVVIKAKKLDDKELQFDHSEIEGLLD